MYRCFTGCMPPKTAWDRAQRRSEGELNFIRQGRVFKQWKKDQDIDTSSWVHDISHLAKRTPENGARTERTWYLIWKSADRCSLKVGHSGCCCRFVSRFETQRHFYLSLEIRLKSIEPQGKIRLFKSVTGYWTDFFNLHFGGVLFVSWVSASRLREPSRSFNRTARQVVERQLNHNMTFRVPWQKFTSLGVTKGLTLSCIQTPVRDQLKS